MNNVPYMCFTCALVFGCWDLSHKIFLKLRKKELIAKQNKFTKLQLFSLKRQPRTILCENSCQFVNLLSFAGSSFYLNMRKLPTAKN